MLSCKWGNGYTENNLAQVGGDGGRLPIGSDVQAEAWNVSKSYPREKGRVGKKNSMWTDWEERV